MEPFEKAIRESLQFFDIWHYKPPDVNMQWPNYWSLQKPSDFIIANIWGEIGFIECKHLASKKFYGKEYERQFSRAVDLDKRFGTFYYIVSFKNTGNIYWFKPTFLLDLQSPIFDPDLSPQYLLHYTEKVTQIGQFGRTNVRYYINLLEIPFFLAPIHQALLLTKPEGVKSDTEKG